MVAGERRAPREALEEHAAEREDVGARVDLAARRAPARAPCSRACRAAARRASGERRPVATRAMPKSRTFARSTCAPARNRFAGLTSRWTTPRACAAPSASADAPTSATLSDDRERPALEARCEALALEPLHGEVELARPRRCRARRSARSPDARARRGPAPRARTARRLLAAAAQELQRDDLAAHAVDRAVNGAHPARSGELLDHESLGDELTTTHTPMLFAARRGSTNPRSLGRIRARSSAPRRAFRTPRKPGTNHA